jgi:Tol biopolymer transport system component
MRRQTQMCLAILALVLPLALGLNAQKADSAEALLRAAADKAAVDGDPNGAIRLYQAIVDRFKTNRAVVATALVGMAESYQKLGNPQSRNVYEQLVRDYTDQKDAAALARARLGAADRTGQSSGLALRKVWDGHAPGLTASNNAVQTMVSGGRLSYTVGNSVNVHDLATGTDRPVAESFGGESVISRDGKQVAYEWYGDPNGSELRLVNVEGTGTGAPAFRRLHASADVAEITPMDFSPDGTSIAVTLVRKDRTKQIGLVFTQSAALTVLKSVDWRGPTRIFFSPDGRDLAFDLPASDTSHQRDVFVLAVDGSREVPAVVHSGNDIVMGWSPDGKHLLFASDRRSGAMGLWALAFADRRPQGAPELVTESINSARSMGVSRSGALYLRVGAGDRDIAVATIDLATGKQTGPLARPIQTFIGTNLQPAWSPDGKFLAYASLRGVSDPRILAIRSVDTGEVRELRPKIAYFNQMSWAPDSRALVTGGTDLKGRDGVFRIDARTGEVETIVLLPQDYANSYPQWSPDGKRIYYRRQLTDGVRSRDVAFVERHLASGEEREVARGDLGSINLSPDGRWIAAGKSDQSTGSSAVVLIPIDGGETREILRGSQGQPILAGFNGMPWTPNGRGVIVRRRSSGDRRESNTELWLVPIADAPPRKLDIDTSKWATGNIGVISLSPDGRQIAFLTGQGKSEVWVLENFLPVLKTSR